MFTMIDWRYRFGRLPVERYRLELGLYTLNEDPAGPRWHPTPLVEQFRDAIDHPEETIGRLARQEFPPESAAPRRESVALLLSSERRLGSHGFSMDVSGCRAALRSSPSVLFSTCDAENRRRNS